MPRLVQIIQRPPLRDQVDTACVTEILNRLDCHTIPTDPVRKAVDRSPCHASLLSNLIERHLLNSLAFTFSGQSNHHERGQSVEVIKKVLWL